VTREDRTPKSHCPRSSVRAATTGRSPRSQSASHPQVLTAFVAAIGSAMCTGFWRIQPVNSVGLVVDRSPW